MRERRARNPIGPEFRSGFMFENVRMTKSDTSMWCSPMVWCSAVTSGVAVVNAVFRIDDHANKVAVILILQSVWIAWGETSNSWA